MEDREGILGSVQCFSPKKVRLPFMTFLAFFFFSSLFITSKVNLKEKNDAAMQTASLWSFLER